MNKKKWLFLSLLFILFIMCFLIYRNYTNGIILKEEQDYIESFFEDKSLFLKAVEAIKTCEWSDREKETGMRFVEENELINISVPRSFIEKYQIEDSIVIKDDKESESFFVDFRIGEMEDGYYSDNMFYFSSSGEPQEKRLGEYIEDIGMFYFFEEATGIMEQYTLRLDEHWFFVKRHYFRY